MRRLILILSLLALSGCATVYDDGYGYYRDDGYGDYYYGHEPAGAVSVGIGLGYGYGYSAYDSLFWGLQHSYFDPFWYPGFRYGVSYFPRYYGWSSWYGSDYWRWRSFHPYSPYYGSYWDHYYAWSPGYGRGHALGRNGHGDPQRYGSARNAAERMARERGLDQRRMEQRSAWSSRSGLDGRRAIYGRSTAGGRGMPAGALGDRAWRGDSLPSRGYAPGVRGKRVQGGFSREPGRSGNRGLRSGAYDAGRATPSRAAGPARNEFQSLPEHGMSAPRSLPDVRGAGPGVPRTSAPRDFQRSAPAPRSMDARPSTRSERSPSVRSSSGRSGGGRSMDRGGGSRGRSQR